MALTAGKAKKMLDDGTVHGRPLTDKQKRYFGAIAGGATPMKKINGGWLDKYAMGGSLPGASGMMYGRSNTMPPLFTQSEMKAPSFADSLTKAQKGDLVVLDESNPEIALEEVVVTAPPKYKYEYEKPEHLKYDPDWWNTGFKGTLDEYNEKYGTDYKEGTALGDYLMDQYYRPQWNEMMLNRDEMQADALNLIGLATTPVSIGPTAITKGPGAFSYLKSGFNKVWNYTPFTKPGFSPTVGNVVNTGFLAEGLRQAPTSVRNMIDNPSWENAGILGLNTLAIAVPGNTGFQYFRPGASGIAPFIDDASRTLVSRTADGSEYLRRSQEALAGGDRYVRKYFNNPITRSRLDDETVKLLKVPEDEFVRRFDQLPEWKEDLNVLMNAGNDSPEFLEVMNKYMRLNPDVPISPGMLTKNLQQRLSKENLDYLYQYQSLPTLSKIESTGSGPGNILGRYTWRENDVVVDVANPYFTGIDSYSSLGRNLFNRLRGKGYTDLGDTSKFNQMRSVAVHEGDHFATVGARGNLDITDERIMAPFVKGMKKWWGRYMDDTGKIDLDSPAAKALKKNEPEVYAQLEYAKYAGTPTELRARITQLRDLYNIKPGEKVDIDTVKEIIRAGKADDMPIGLGREFSQFFEFIDDPESFRYILNNMSKTGSRIKKAQTGDIAPGANFESVERAVRNVESLDGLLMMNPKSSATGLYGQLWNPISGTYDGTREDFSKDTIYQKQLFNDRFYKGIAATETTSLLRDSNELYQEYLPIVEEYDISYNDLAVLANFLGRQGTRYYLGYHLRDGKPLAEAIPNIYGPNAKYKNKTPQEYLDLARPHYKNGGWLDKYEVIEDDMGQLTNPGKITKINSNNITMKGVDFPVLGISDTGDKKMMQPGKDYKFDGNSVTEYPMKGQGGMNVPLKMINEFGELERLTYPSSKFKDKEGKPEQLVMLDEVVVEADNPITVAKEQMEKYGITDQLKKGYVKGKSEKAFNNITPQGYGDQELNMERLSAFLKGDGRNPDSLLYQEENGKKEYYTIPTRDDAFSLYLGLPQKNDSFSVSDYKPSQAKDPSMIYYKPWWADEDKYRQRIVYEYFDGGYKDVEGSETKKLVNERTALAIPNTWKKDGDPWSYADNALGDFTVDYGEDEKGHYIAIYDKWDLNPFEQGVGSSVNQFGSALLNAYNTLRGKNPKATEATEVSEIFGAGKPFEIYERIYFDPETKKIIDMKQGGSLVKLDQLTNFTNYNTPQPGGWLDKY